MTLTFQSALEVIDSIVNTTHFDCILFDVLGQEVDLFTFNFGNLYQSIPS